MPVDQLIDAGIAQGLGITLETINRYQIRGDADVIAGMSEQHLKNAGANRLELLEGGSSLWSAKLECQITLRHCLDVLQIGVEQNTPRGMGVIPAR
jgi:hypothetical protein